tara:strand:- start:799 stop:963 length:165 start_codon:yes stop_codon:yes gene_type:complete
MRQNGSDDPTIEAMKMSGIEITRENYLNYIFPDGVPEDYGAELEAEMPEQFREK